MMATDGDGEVIISFGGDDEDDDDMLDLFSFGADSTSDAKPPATAGSRNEKTNNVSEAMKSVMPLPPSKDDNDDSNHGSEDSFIELLEQQQKDVSFVDPPQTLSARHVIENDSDIKDIMDWLDNDDERNGGHDTDEDELIFVEPPRQPSLAESIPTSDPTSLSPKEYESLEEAVKDSESSLFQIRRSLEKENFVVPSHVRPWLWAKVICGKTLEETLQSSIAESFQQWEVHLKENENQDLSAISLHSHEESPNESVGSTGTVLDQSLMPQQTRPSQQVQKRDWLEKQSKSLARRIAKVSKCGNLPQHQQDLFAILMNYEGGRSLEEWSEGESTNPSWKDPLLPPVACTILSGGVPKVAAAVMLSQIIPKFMPMVSLSVKERAQVAGILHQQFYLLCSYHLPLLVLHLDKYIPGWYKWPPKGQLPQSWLVSQLAGEAEDGFMTNPQLLLCLWDVLLTSANSSLRFYLVIAILDRHAERLLLLTGTKLKDEFHLVLSFSAKPEMDEDDDFAVDADAELSIEQANNIVRLWSDKAFALWEETPISVSKMLETMEDEAVSEALVARQKEKDEWFRLRQEAQAKAQQEALEAEREKKENEARLRLTRARLVAFYRQHNPGKETNIEKIMMSYEGRYDVLDAKLKQKYGIGFNPALVPKISKGSNNFLPTINSSFGGRRTFGKRKEDQEPNQALLRRERVVVNVVASEVLPIICWSKEANQINMQKLKKSSKLEYYQDGRLPLKFYLVDCRPEPSTHEQGRIPTSVNFIPDQLVDKDQLKAQEEMFESLRGAVHICVMGEGYGALPTLYGHKMTKGLSELIKEDDTRINNCALFFFSRGFPFVSILEGGFAAAHSYLCQDGPNQHLYAKNVLTDYDPDVSIFAQFERANNTTSREKAQRSLQNMFDSSMLVLTKSTMRFESSDHNVDEISKPKAEQKNVVLRLFGGTRDGAVDEKGGILEEQDSIPTGNLHTQSSMPFRNPFARHIHGHPELSSSSHNEISTVSVLSDASSLDAEKALSERNHISESRTNLEKTSPDHGLGQASSSQKIGGFAGFGAALNNPLKTQNVRNPFARFGTTSSNEGSKIKEANSGQGIGNHFASLNQFRKNMMKSNDSHKVEQTILLEPTVAALQLVGTQEATGEVKPNETLDECPTGSPTKSRIPLAAEIAKV